MTMMMNAFLLTVSLLLFPMISAQGGGSFRCPICWRSGCRVPASSRGNRINVPNLGSRTCGDVQDTAAANMFFPDECSWVQSVTLRTTNPCDCPCDPPTLATPCQLCPPGEIISDPDFVIRDPALAGFTCGFIFDNPTFISESFCPTVAEIVRRECGCRSLTEPSAPQCIPQEEPDVPCHPGGAACCDDIPCIHRQSFPGVYVCSAKGNQPWSGRPYAGPPGSAPAPSPMATSPTPRPTIFRAPQQEDCREPGKECLTGFKCLDTTSHGWRCVNSSSGSCMKSSRPSSTRGGASGSNGC